MLCPATFEGLIRTVEGAETQFLRDWLHEAAWGKRLGKQVSTTYLKCLASPGYLLSALEDLQAEINGSPDLRDFRWALSKDPNQGHWRWKAKWGTQHVVVVRHGDLTHLLLSGMVLSAHFLTSCPDPNTLAQWVPTKHH